MIESEDRQVLLHVTLCAQPGTEKTAMEQVEQALCESGCTERDRLEDMKTMTAEACLNAIEHGCGFCANLYYEVELTREGREFVLCVRDRGGPHARQTRPDLYYSRDTITFQHIDDVMKDSRESRGWGLVMIDALSDSWTLKGDGENTELEIRLMGPRPRGGNVGV